MTCDLSNIEVMGRDVSIISKNPASINIDISDGKDKKEGEEQEVAIRSIIDADTKISLGEEKVKFSLKKNKVFIFNWDTQERIYIEE